MPPPGVGDDAPAPTRLPEAAPAEDGKRTITTGLIVLGGAVAAGAGSVYSWREKGQRAEQLEQAEQYNETAGPAGLPTMPTAGLRDKVELYRGLTIGLAVTAGVLALVGGGVTLAGLRARRRAARITGLGWAVQF